MRIISYILCCIYVLYILSNTNGRKKKTDVLSGFSERRSGILKVYEQAKSDLETLNTDIQNQISANTEEMNRIAAENKQLANLKSNNESTIKAFTKLFR